MEQEQTPQTNELLILQALEAIMSTQKNHSLMLIALLEILASPSESPSMKDLINLGLFKVTEIEKKAGLTPLMMPKTPTYEELKEKMSNNENTTTQEESYQKMLTAVMEILGVTKEELQQTKSELDV